MLKKTVFGSVTAVGIFWISTSNLNIFKAFKATDLTGLDRAKVVVLSIATESDEIEEISQASTSNSIDLKETTFLGITILEWLDLSNSLIIPFVAAIIGWQLKRRDKLREEKESQIRAEEQKAREREKNLEQEARHQEQMLESYFDRMSKLLLEEELGPDSATRSEVQKIAQSITLNVLRHLNSGT